MPTTRTRTTSAIIAALTLSACAIAFLSTEFATKKSRDDNQTRITCAHGYSQTLLTFIDKGMPAWVVHDVIRVHDTRWREMGC